jgi:hypothetical protein
VWASLFLEGYKRQMARLTHTWLIDPTKRDIHPDKPPPEPSNLRRQCAPSFGPVPTDFARAEPPLLLRSLSVALALCGRTVVGSGGNRPRRAQAPGTVGGCACRLGLAASCRFARCARATAEAALN